MTKDISKLSDEERQSLADELHALNVMPSILQGSGSPAHVAMISASLNDLRQVVSLQSTNVNRLFEIVAKQAAMIESLLSPAKAEPRLPGERDH